MHTDRCQDEINWFWSQPANNLKCCYLGFQTGGVTHFNIALDWNAQQKNYLFIWHNLQSILFVMLFFKYFNIIFKYHQWAGEYIYSRTVHLTLTYNFNAYPKQVSMSVTLTSKQQQWWCQLIIFNFGKQILLKINGVHSRILTLSANIYNGCLSPI